MPEEVIKILLSLDTSTAAGIDQIPAKHQKDNPTVLPLPLRDIENFSIKLSIFPGESKIAKLQLIFIKDTKTDPKNYHPVLLLPLFLKIIENSIYFQIENYLSKKKRIYLYQPGSRINRLTEFCPAQLTDFVLTGMENICMLT